MLDSLVRVSRRVGRFGYLNYLERTLVRALKAYAHGKTCANKDCLLRTIPYRHHLLAYPSSPLPQLFRLRMHSQMPSSAPITPLAWAPTGRIQHNHTPPFLQRAGECLRGNPFNGALPSDLPPHSISPQTFRLS